MENNDFSLLVKQYENINTKLDKISDKVTSLNNETIVQRMDIDHLKAEVVLLKDEQRNVKEQINLLENADNAKKAKRWDTIINRVLIGICSIVGAAVLAFLGIKL